MHRTVGLTDYLTLENTSAKKGCRVVHLLAFITFWPHSADVCEYWETIIRLLCVPCRWYHMKT